MSTARLVTPEVLDGLAADDPKSLRARRDLRRVHAAMRSVSILRDAVSRLRLKAPPHRILELGAGDGTLLLRLARALKPPWRDVDLTLLDRLDLLGARTRAGYLHLGWRVRVECADALDWAATQRGRSYDLCFANLFLHHFETADLALLLDGVARATDAFVACEPRRTPLAHWGSRLVVLLGASAVTREDAVKSVAAGFAGRELSDAWARAGSGWRAEEYAALPFTQCLLAVRAGNGEGAHGR